MGTPTRGATVTAQGTNQYIIADQFNNRVIEVDESGNILWHFGGGPKNITASAIIGVNDAQRVDDNHVLMAGTGAPPGTEPSCPAGCADNRVLIVSRHPLAITWQYGTFGVTGSGANQLNAPVQATYLPSGNVLITDQGNQRVIEVNAQKQIVWQYGTTGVAGTGFNQLNSPNSAELLANGQILIADEGNNRAIQVTRNKGIAKTFTAGGTVGAVAFASRLPNFHALLTDAGHNRIVEVDANDNVVWHYSTYLQTGSNKNPQPTRAVRLANGNTLISDQFNNRVIEVRATGSAGGTIVRSFGILNTAGYSTTTTQAGMNAPYDAKLIGDFTGLTPPTQGFPTAAAVTAGNPTFTFTPDSVDIANSGTVTWTFTGLTHSVVWDGTAPTCNGGSCDIGLTTTGNVARTFTSAGTFNYHCGVHGPIMHGVIVIH